MSGVSAFRPRFVAAAFALVVVLGGSLPAGAVDVWSIGLDVANGDPLQRPRQLIASGRYREAVTVLEPLVASRPNHAEALNLMGFAQRKSGDVETARGFYLRALEADPNHVGANEYLGELYIETGDLPKANERLQRLEAICGVGCEEYLELKEKIDAAS